MSKNLAGAVLVGALAFAVYANTLQNGFAWDDPILIIQNEEIHEASWLTFLTTPHGGKGTRGVGAWVYRPLVDISLALNWRLGGGNNPSGFHLTNVLLHVACTLLVFVLLLELTGSARGALAGAAVFAVHPVHTEAVNNISFRADLLATLFYLTACILYLRRPGAAVRVAGITLCYVLALGGKEMAITLPAVLLLLEARRAEAGRIPRAIREDWWLFLGLVLITLIYVAIRSEVLQAEVWLPAYVGSLTLQERIATPVRNLVFEHWRLLLWPQDLTVDYGSSRIQTVGATHPTFMVAALALSSLCALAILGLKRCPLASVAIGWYMVTILPVSNLLFLFSIWVAERTLYLPSVALSILTAVTIRKLPAGLRVWTPAALVALLFLGGWRTWVRNADWRSNETLMAALFRDHPRSTVANVNLGLSLYQQGQSQKALPHLRLAYQALEHNHENAFHGPVVLALGTTYLRYGLWEEAEAVLRPHPELSVPGWPGASPSREVYLVQAWRERGETEKARMVLEESLGKWPDEKPLLGLRSEFFPDSGQ
ncbi:MAG: tetratricopeptide repeat protein [Gemmatimonadetes bacterium]|nr:tetratricopeptide repeat protein [Gemmatimonadota bacterium]